MTMTFAELPEGACYHIIGVPQHRLRKCRYGISVTTDLEMFLCRPDVEVEQEAAKEEVGL